MSLPILLAGCSGAKSLQNTLAPDPKLTQSDPNGTVVATSPAASNTALTDFPKYPQAKLLSTEQSTAAGSVTTWTTADPIDVVYKFYQTELPVKQWEIVKSPSDTESLLVARQAEMTASIAPVSQDKQQSETTTYSITLQGATAPIPTPTATTTPTPTPLPISKSSTAPPTSNTEYLTDLNKLGVFSSADLTAANPVVKRRAYARWLLAAYNRINITKPTQQIKLATSNSKPAFQDVPTTDPDFASIQGLAEAGLIRSPLSGDATAVLFRPDAPLTREQMILWKVPLDTRQALPSASLDAIKQTWGFQDAGKIEPQALRAVLADFQNGDLANIRRVYGYTTLFQPKKPVTLGEVAIAIWYFGANGEGISAREALQAANN